MPSGAPAVLAEPVYWWNTRQAPADPRVDRDLRPRRRPRPPPRPATRPARPVDDTGLSSTAQPPAVRIRSPAPGRWWSRPSAACSSSTSRRSRRKALDRRAGGLLDASGSSSSPQRRRAAARRAGRPARPLLPDPRGVGRRNGCSPYTAARCSATTGCGARSGGVTPRPSPAWSRCGERGSTCAKTPRPACRSGFATTPTTT